MNIIAFAGKCGTLKSVLDFVRVQTPGGKFHPISSVIPMSPSFSDKPPFYEGVPVAKNPFPKAKLITLSRFDDTPLFECSLAELLQFELYPKSGFTERWQSLSQPYHFLASFLINNVQVEKQPALDYSIPFTERSRQRSQLWKMSFVQDNVTLDCVYLPGGNLPSNFSLPKKLNILVAKDFGEHTFPSLITYAKPPSLLKGLYKRIEEAERDNYLNGAILKLLQHCLIANYQENDAEEFIIETMQSYGWTREEVRGVYLRVRTYLYEVEGRGDVIIGNYRYVPSFENAKVPGDYCTLAVVNFNLFNPENRTDGAVLVTMCDKTRHVPTFFTKRESVEGSSYGFKLGDDGYLCLVFYNMSQESKMPQNISFESVNGFIKQGNNLNVMKMMRNDIKEMGNATGGEKFIIL